METHINEVMCTMLKVQSIESWTEAYNRAKQGADKDTRKSAALDAYITVVARLKYLIHYNQAWYVYTNEGYHKSTSLNALPCISMWVYNSAKRYIENQSSRFEEPNMWSTCDFMFATSVGVFNSVTGLYAAKVPLLRFTKSRNYEV